MPKINNSKKIKPSKNIDKQEKNIEPTVPKSAYEVGFIITLMLLSYNYGTNNPQEKNVDQRLALEYYTDTLSHAYEKEMELHQKESIEQPSIFNINDLIVIEGLNVVGKSELYILKRSEIDGIYYEYNNLFKAWYKPHPSFEIHPYSFCSEYVHFDDYIPLYKFISETEYYKKMVSLQNGYLTISDLNNIEKYIRKQYCIPKEQSKIKLLSTKM